MSIDQTMAVMALCFLAASWLIWWRGTNRLPAQPGPLKEHLVGMWRDLVFFRVCIPSVVIVLVIFGCGFWVLDHYGYVDEKGSAAWKCMSSLTGVVFIFSVAFHESVRSFNSMRA